MMAAISMRPRSPAEACGLHLQDVDRIVAGVIDERTYKKGFEVSNAEMPLLNVTGDDIHPDWNCNIQP